MFEQLRADPELGGSSTVRFILNSEIYARMGMCLEREACFQAALVPTVLAHFIRARFHAVRNCRSELARLPAPAVLHHYITPLSARARLAHTLGKLRTVIAKHLDQLPQLNVHELRAESRPELPTPARAFACLRLQATRNRRPMGGDRPACGACGRRDQALAHIAADPRHGQVTR